MSLVTFVERDIFFGKRARRLAETKTTN